LLREVLKTLATPPQSVRKFCYATEKYSTNISKLFDVGIFSKIKQEIMEKVHRPV
jgi:hypothetical protein